MGTDEIDYELVITLEDNGSGGKRFVPPRLALPIGVKTGSARVRWTFPSDFPADLEPVLAFDWGDAVEGSPVTTTGASLTVTGKIRFPAAEAGPGRDRVSAAYKLSTRPRGGLMPSTIDPMNANLVIDRSVDPPGGRPPHPHRHPRRPRGGAGKAPEPYSPTRRRNSGLPASER